MARTEAPAAPRQTQLKRELGVFELTATGVGIILGAGIYVIIGRAAGMAGGAVWVSFLMAAFAAALTGLTYAELAPKFPKAGASFEYAKQAFGLRIGFLVGWLFVFTNVVSAGAVALGFGGYLQGFLGVAVVPMALALIGLATLVLFVGVKQSVWLGILFTAIEVGGLLIVIAVSARFIGGADYLEMPEGVGGLFRATTLIFFAYLGFEQIANLSEEARDARRGIPAAVILAVAISTVLYVAVAVSAVSALDWRALSQSSAPLSDVVEAATGAETSRVVGIIALFATANTVLFLLLTASRLMFGMAESRTLPPALSRVHWRRRTPWAATIAAAAIAASFALIGDIEFVAQLTNFTILAAFVVVNLSLIWLRYSRPDTERGFRVPLNIGRLPVPTVLATAVSLFMLANVGLSVMAYGAIIVALGLAVPLVIRGFGKGETA